MNLHVINAAEGDCLLVETGGLQPKRLLIDGGPRGIWETHAKTHLTAALGAERYLDAICVSHVDADHIIGVLDLLADVERGRANGESAFRIGDLWHNSFSETVDTPDSQISRGLEMLLDAAGQANIAMPDSGSSLYGIAEGARLRRSAIRLGVPINAAFTSSLISPDALMHPRISFGQADITVAGPTKSNLLELQSDWLKWLEKNADALADPDPSALANADKSIPNLSSIVLYVEENGRSLLLTGDARGDHILQGLSAIGLLDRSLHVNVLKVQHHGSDRNANSDFFRQVTADRYVISANGRYGNPDHATLMWIVDAAETAQRPIEIIVTNNAPAIDELRRTHPPEEHGYALTIIDGSAKTIEV